MKFGVNTKCKYTLQIATSTRCMELFELYLKEKAVFFLLKFLFVKVRCLINDNKICGLLRIR